MQKFVFPQIDLLYTGSTAGSSVAEPHHFDAAPTPGKNFDAAPAPTLLYSKENFLKRTTV
jgi:hypothetical protein